ncbi:MAG: acylneuraminate cytidylyltransferase [Cyclobacteriaceae bacterium]|nr:acylneuraminate cytidylyltransferase [Cyclobacteriaceae bacterium]
MPSVLVIIPARGGSKGIPRKNLRPLNGKPLLHYAIHLALLSKYKPHVVVTTDDEEIGYFATQLGATVHYRDNALGDDDVTLDPVIYEAYVKTVERTNKAYDIVATLQPTAPLLSVLSFDGAIQRLGNKDIDTIISVGEEKYLTWQKRGEVFMPLYEARVNHRLLPKMYRETGGFLISRAESISNDSRIGSRVDLYVVPQEEAIDIDTHADWSICEYLLRRKTVLFCVSGYPEIGLGHVYNCLILANEILDHRIVFLVDSKSQLAFDKISESNYEVHIQTSEDIIDDISSLSPAVVINDRLDTTEDYIRALKSRAFKVVNIEDLGTGARHADMVFNAIYPEAEALPGHFVGSNYFCARDEFYLLKQKQFSNDVKSILITFGGVDPNNLTQKTLDAIYDHCVKAGIKITVVLGLGYKKEESLKRFLNVEISRNSKRISQFMQEADIAFSSAGRTIYELALTHTPSIIMAQNDRELSHVFAERKNGFLHLGLGSVLTRDAIQHAFLELVSQTAVRKQLFDSMNEIDLRSGKSRVVKLLKDLIAK